MSLISSCLKNIEDYPLDFEPFPCHSVEIQSSGQGLTVSEKTLLRSESISAWIDQTESYQANQSSEFFYLRLLCQQWPNDRQLASEKKVPFTETVFDHITNAFNFPPEFLYLFHQNKYTPLQVRLPKDENGCTTMIFQSPTFKSFSMLVLSYDANTRVTSGFYGYNNSKINVHFIELLKRAKLHAAHPLLLPTLFFRTWITTFSQENNGQTYNMELIKDVTGGGSDLDRDLNADINKAHRLIVLVHNCVNNAMEVFIAASAANLQAALARIHEIVGNGDSMKNITASHEEILALLAVLSITQNCCINERRRLRKRLHMQLQVLYNMMQQGDSKENREMAKLSTRIAADSKALTARSKEIAEATMLDGSATKTISIMTMVFLPGTAIATILSMSSFFETGANGTMVVSPKFWIYWIVTIPVTAMIVGSWWFTLQRQSKDFKKLEERQGTESLQGEGILTT